MTLPGTASESGRVVGRYIGSQGPLPSTVDDFWRMVWEQRVHLVLMLTAETEGRRVKCHQYWPHRGETPTRHGQLTVSCTSEHKTSSATVRDFQLTSSTVCTTVTTTVCCTSSVKTKFLDLTETILKYNTEFLYCPGMQVN